MLESQGIIGNYLVERELGRGGMGVVYAAKHRVLGRPAAIKVLLANTSEHRDRVERFFNEARAAMAIKHRGVVEVFDVGIAADGRAYLAMELLHGVSLGSQLARGPLPLRQAIDHARQLADALAAAHAAGVIHRDLKPENIIVTPERVVIVDFGIAKLAGPASVRTATGALIGTPLYMSPEQCEGLREIDVRSDLYSLGCVLFAMLTGRPPFEGGGTGGLIGAHLHVAPPLLRTRCIHASEALERVISVLLAKSPEERFGSARAVAEALARPDVTELVGRPGVAATADFAPSQVPRVPSISNVPSISSDPTVSSGNLVAPPSGTSHAVPSDPGGLAPASTPTRRDRRVVIAMMAGGCAIIALVLILVGTRTRPRDHIVAEVPDAAIVEPDAAIIARAISDARVVDAPATHELTDDELGALIRSAGGKRQDKRPRPEIVAHVDNRVGSGSARPGPEHLEPRQLEPERQPESVRPLEPERQPEPERRPEIHERVSFATGSFSTSEVPRPLVARVQATIKADPSRKVIVTGRADADESRDPKGLATARANAVMLALTSGIDRVPRGSIVTRTVVDSDGSGRRADVELSP